MKETTFMQAQTAAEKGVNRVMAGSMAVARHIGNPPRVQVYRYLYH
jgi:hypothetical protein